jgi:hypothetical protein
MHVSLAVTHVVLASVHWSAAQHVSNAPPHGQTQLPLRHTDAEVLGPLAAEHCPPSGMHVPFPVKSLQQPPRGHAASVLVAWNVEQQGWPGAPQAWHCPAEHTVPAAVHAVPGARHLFVSASQQSSVATPPDPGQGAPEVQHTMPAPHAGPAIVTPEHD